MTSINPTVSILSMLEPVAPKPCLAISGKQPPWFHSWVVSQPGGSPGNPAKLLEKDWRETTGNSSGRGPWFCNTQKQRMRFFLVIRLDQVGFRPLETLSSEDEQVCSELPLSCVVTLPWHVLYTWHTVWHTSSWNWNVCLMMFHGDFPSFSPKENMQGHSFEVACNHSSQLHGSWVHFVSPSLNLCICNRIAMTFNDNKNRWKDCLAMSAEAHASLLVKAILPSKHSICGYNKGVRSCHFHVNLTRASETILMQTSSSLGNPLQGQSGINLNHRCTNLLYCKQYCIQL